MSTFDENSFVEVNYSDFSSRADVEEEMLMIEEEQLGEDELEVDYPNLIQHLRNQGFESLARKYEQLMEEMEQSDG
jgi:hypothetical protein